jgi:hypothetical protein
MVESLRVHAMDACALEPYSERDHLQHRSYPCFHHCAKHALRRRHCDGAFFVGQRNRLVPVTTAKRWKPSSRSRGTACAPLS